MMNSRILKMTAISIMLLVFSLESTGILYATVTMEEVEALFIKETGKDWENVTSQERKDFLYNVMGRKHKEEREKRIEGEKTPYFIKEGFQRSRGRDWDDVSEEERQRYINNYKIKRAKDEAAEEQRREAAKRRDEAIKLRKEREKEALARKKEEKERIKAEKKARKERKREAARQKLERMKDKFERQRSRR